MTGTEIITFTEDALLDDKIGDAIKLGLINEAIRDISRQAPFISVASIEFLAGINTVDLDSLFRSTDSLKMEDGTELTFKHPADISKLNETGTPVNYYYTDMKLAIHPIPTSDITLNHVFRKGYTEISALNEIPNIPLIYHDAICYYVAWKMGSEFGTNLLTQSKLNMFRSEYYSRISQLLLDVETNFGNYQVTEDVLPSRKVR